MTKMAERNPKVAEVTESTERPYEKAKADPEDIAAAENRETVDQIPNYHKDHPTLKTDDKAHDPVKQAEAKEKDQG